METFHIVEEDNEVSQLFNLRSFFFSESEVNLSKKRAMVRELEFSILNTEIQI